MAYKANFGSGALGDVANPEVTINSYARVTAVTPTSITINDTAKITGSATFGVGAKIMIHVSAVASTEVKHLGNWLIATITAVNANVFTLDVDPTTCIPTEDLAKYYVQAIAIAEYKNLTLDTGCVVTPPVYSSTNYQGGIVAIMCSETLTFNGGNIALNDRGISPSTKTLRPSTQNDVIEDISDCSGWENSDTHIHFMLNVGDGAAFLCAKKLVCSADSRIGNPATKGVQFYRGSSTSVTYNESAPSGVTNVGGSTIFIAADTIENFTCAMLAKYRNKSSATGQGICRCYIASETKLRNDEGLYAYDCISHPDRIKRMNIKNFGNGSFGDIACSNIKLNNYATITAIDGRKISYKNQTVDGLAQIGAGALVMIHFNHKSTKHVVDSGRFILANVLADNGSTLTIDADPPNISITDYAAQIVAVPQFNNFTLSVSIEPESIFRFDGNQGGIWAIACKGTCDLSDGKIKVTRRSSGSAYGREGLAVIGNAQDSDKLPIGQGNASVFILADKLLIGQYTYIGKTGYSSKDARGYRGYGFDWARMTQNLSDKQYASGARGSGVNGGYGSNGFTSATFPALQGAHVMIVADTISGLSCAAVATGGIGHQYNGCGYGADGRAHANNGGSTDYGGYNGGGSGYHHSGGSSGWCFIYCRHVINQDTGGTVRPN